MKFLIYTILTDENSVNLNRFLSEMKPVKLPIEVVVYDCRTDKYDSVRKDLKKHRNNGVISFEKSKSILDAHGSGIYKAKIETYGSTAFIDLSISSINEIELTTLLVRAMDLGAVVPFTVSEKGVGCFVSLLTKTDFTPVFSSEIGMEEQIVCPTIIYAISRVTALECVYSDHSEGEGSKVYRLFVKNNVRFNALENCIFEED